ncbi:hypothetical protein RB623_28840 [Mesorhizobium sp. LHD-90]|uniref:hypothetical protein n=1 Tax=Mesorhizobium sp. LHD-90 TaxID=3071414 RepID=UPI0027DFCCC3|nr:hypothetical protein [Mesorhizobium sp. LHD-90]MDQ6438079.1 hypothetical protein [Mesorhizobium sp. LHD-90]
MLAMLEAAMEPKSSDTETLLEKMSELLAMAGLGGINLETVSAEHEAALRKLAQFQPVQLAAVFGGLLTQPVLQANCVRLEALAHLSLALGNGPTKPSAKVTCP